LLLAKQLVIFDIEGTLIDCVPQSLMCWREALASCGYEFSIEQLHQHSGRDPDEMIRLLLPEAAAGRLAEQLKNTQGQCYRERFLNAVKPFPGVRALFLGTKSTGAVIGLATTCSGGEMRHYCRVAEISELVDHTACGEDVEQEKPHPDLIKLVLSRANVAPGDAVMVGDTPYDAQADGGRPFRRWASCRAALREPSLRRPDAPRSMLIRRRFSKPWKRFPRTHELEP
jgi:beta-phosphoglucomutase-like phosphatase (HAD superfamily)